MVGNQVWWTDPDDDKCSHRGRVIKVQHLPIEKDTVITVQEGSEILEALPHELTKLP